MVGTPRPWKAECESPTTPIPRRSPATSTTTAYMCSLRFLIFLEFNWCSIVQSWKIRPYSKLLLEKFHNSPSDSICAVKLFIARACLPQFVLAWEVEMEIITFDLSCLISSLPIRARATRNEEEKRAFLVLTREQLQNRLLCKWQPCKTHLFLLLIILHEFRNVGLDFSTTPSTR